MKIVESPGLEKDAGYNCLEIITRLFEALI